MNIYDNVSYGLMVRGVDPGERMGPVEEMLHMMNLDNYVSLYPKELSGGARQKTAISRALTSGSTLLLLDEPLGALDLKVRTVLRYELRRLVKDLGLTAIHVTHDQEEALSVSDRIVVMRSGKIVEFGTPKQLYLRPEKIFTAKFLGEANFLEGDVISAEGGVIEAEVNGAKLRAKTQVEGLKKGERCVFAIRPEFLTLTKTPEESNSWRCEVVNAGFVGDTMRYDLKTVNGVTLLAKAPTSSNASVYTAGDELYVTLPEEYLLTYRQPEEGLEKALSLE
jgi:ABC-type Fe3+/spermidine/putrescine transport system ATPase subunit